jgi:asparagine synthase (glutamine-hydrolysing)
MCGIFGINKIKDNSIIDAANTFSYRGPDYTGVYADNDLTLVHHRLSIIDTSLAGNQPMLSSDNSVVLVFNGEIYNFKEIKKNYFPNDHFFSNSDSEVIIKAYQKFGVNLTRYLRGMYAFAVYDKKKRKIFLFRDQMGIKPLYYYLYNGEFIFSSEIKGILHYLKPYNKIEIDKSLVDIYFSLGYIPSPNTLYKNIYKLEAGHYLEYDVIDKKILFNNKFDFFRLENFSVDKQTFFDLFEKNILDHLNSDVPVGLFFSGGTDSSLIAAILNKNKINLKTFSILMNHKSSDEYYSKLISEKLNLNSQFIQFGVKEFDSVYDQVVSQIDEPMYDASIFPTFFVSRIASNSVKVVLSGEGGDEFFYGYKRHAYLKKINTNPKDDHFTFLDKLYTSLPRFSGKNRLFEKLFLLNNQPYSFYLLSVAISLNKAGFIDAKKYLSNINKNFDSVEIDQNSYLENDLLKKLDMATSYNSIEGRVPLLDLGIISASKNFPIDYFFHQKVNKYLLKEYLFKYLPKHLVYRNKSGFGIDPSFLIDKSSKINLELNDILNYLSKNDLFPFKNDQKSIQDIKLRRPYVIFAAIMLFHSIKNYDNL